MAIYKQGVESSVAGAILNTTAPTSGTLEHTLQEIEKHMHPVGGQFAYPTGVVPVTLTSAATSDTYGAWTQVVPADTITYKFNADEVFIVEVSDAARNYVLQLGAGAEGAEVVYATIPIGKATTDKGIDQFTLRTSRIAANARVAARIKDDEAATNTMGIYIGYHEYPTIP